MYIYVYIYIYVNERAIACSTDPEKGYDHRSSKMISSRRSAHRLMEPEIRSKPSSQVHPQ